MRLTGGQGGHDGLVPDDGDDDDDHGDNNDDHVQRVPSDRRGSSGVMMMVLYLMVVLRMIDSNCYSNDDYSRTECFVCLKGGTRLAVCQVSMVDLYPAMIMMMI